MVNASNKLSKHSSSITNNLNEQPSVVQQENQRQSKLEKMQQSKSMSPVMKSKGGP